MSQNKIILFCYAFIIGIAFSMLHPLAANWLSPLWMVTLASFVLAAGLLVAWGRQAEKSGRTSVWISLALLLAGVCFGYSRYLGQLQMPDRQVGRISVSGEQLEWHETAALGETSLLALRLQSASGEAPVTLSLEGELNARYPERNEKGQPLLAENGRWQLIEVRVPQASSVVIPPNSPPGTLIPIDEPFSSIRAVKLAGGKDTLQLALLRIPARVAEFTRPGRDTVPVSILGRITQDPWVYSFKTVLTVTPDLIQYQPDGPYFEIEKGSIRVTVDPAVPGYSQLARSSAYGNDVWIRGQLQTPPAAANPGAFSQRQYLLSQHIEGQMNLRPSRDGKTTPIETIRPQGLELRSGNALVAFSLGLRDNLLRVIKQTIPHPNSAFLGAVSLGLRYGMHDTETLLSEDHSDSPVPPLFRAVPGSNQLISHEFRAAGINHVLAVSGLHVTIITAMFVGIFSLLRVSRRAYVPVVILILIIFAIITGARPSTMRAVIMNSLFLITWGYLHQTLRTSVLLGVPVAAFIILVQNPAMLVDPSFTLSFGAILSLALLTQPAYDLLRHFRGNDLLALFICIVMVTAAMIHNWFLVASPVFWLIFAPFAAALFLVARALTKCNIRLIGHFVFEDIPQSVSVFLAAQIGIQLGMMVPLSAFYFHRWASAGAYANLVAIPLIGVILQLGMLGGIIGLIPAIGIYIALLLNAANWICSSLFILLGHYSAAWFPFPFVRKQSLAGLGVYYALLALAVWHRPVLERLSPYWRKIPRKARPAAAGALCVLLVLAIGANRLAARQAEPHLRISVLAVNYGSAILVETPGGKNILIDTGFVQKDMGRRNEAERTILPYLSTRRIGKLDALILTSPAAERILGAAEVIGNMRVGRLVMPTMLQPSVFPDRLARIIRRRGHTLLNRIAGTVLETLYITNAQTLFEEDIDGLPFRLEAIAPRGGTDGAHPLALRITHGEFSMLIPSDITWEQQRQLAAQHPDLLKADILIAPARGVNKMAMMDQDDSASDRISAEFFRAAAPSRIIYEFGNPRPVVGSLNREVIASHSRNRRIAEDYAGIEHVHVTDRDGAVLIESDGINWRLTTQADRLDGAEDSVTDMELGF